MAKGMLGRKLGMMGIFSPDGRYMPVTILQVGPCTVTQVKRRATDGYDALQLGFGTRRKTQKSKPLMGHLKKSGGEPFAVLREFPVENPDGFDVGQVLGLELFQVGERINVSGKTKGRGFSGVVKRHGFHGGKKTHGSNSHRVPGSIGASAWPSRVIKGKKLPGRYGFERQTMRNLEIVDIRPEQNLLMVKGAVPGARNGVVEIRKPKFAR